VSLRLSNKADDVEGRERASGMAMVVFDCAGFLKRSKEAAGLSSSILARRAGRTESSMPANFGEIADYNNRLAAGYHALAEAAREGGDLAQADYQDALAARYLAVAQEQTLAMQQEPGRSFGNQTSSCSFPEPRRIPPVAGSFLGVLRGPGQVARAVCQFLSRRNAPFHGLSLH